MRWLDEFLSDVKLVGRFGRRAPFFVATVVAMLVAGIGATTAVYSVLRHVLLRPLPYAEPERLVQLFSQSPVEMITRSSGSQFRLWQDETLGAFEALSAYDDRTVPLPLSSERRAEVVRSLRVSSGFFTVFRIPVVRGRNLRREDDATQGPRVVVISEGFWQRRFGAGDVVGQTLWLGNEAHEIVGVVARSFVSDPAADVFMPLRVDALTSDDTRRFRVVGRLRTGVSVGSARQLVAGTTARYRRDHPFVLGQREYFTADTLHAVSVGPVKPTLQLLSGAVALLLLVACANVATLLLSRGRSRVVEVAARAALGASRARLVRQLLTESTCLALAGAALAVPVAQLGLQIVLQLGTDGAAASLLPLVSGATLDAHVIAMGVVTGLVTGLLCGAVPAMSISRADVSAMFKPGGSSAVATWRAGGAHSTLLLAQVAMAVVLLAATVSVLESLGRLQRLDRGFDADRVLTMEASLGPAGAQGADPDAFVARTASRLLEVAGIAAVAASYLLPTDHGAVAPFVMNERGLFATGAHHGSTRWEIVTPEYFATLGIDTLHGRVPDAQDVRGAPAIAVINRTMARRYWGDRDVVGQRVTLGSADQPGDSTRAIVGVVADTRGRDSGESEPTLYIPMAQAGEDLLRRQQAIAPLRWLLRTSTDPRLVGAAAFAAVEQAAPGAAVNQPTPMSDLLQAQVARASFALQLVGGFGVLSLVMALVGLYGFVRHAVRQRTKELSIRNTLGASRPQLLRLVLGQGAAIMAIGTVVGAVGAVSLGAALEHYVFGVKAPSPSAVLAITLLLMLAAGAALLVAAWPSVEVDPRRVVE